MIVDLASLVLNIPDNGFDLVQLGHILIPVFLNAVVVDVVYAVEYFD
jgi:hypothetical protein